MFAVVDYRMGNLMSVERGLVAAGADARITDDAAAIARAEAIVLPGVGAFGDAADSMRELGQMDVIRDRVAAGVPFLGICLGLQLMFEEGVEGSPDQDDEASSRNAQGLAILPGVVTKMPSYDAEGRLYKIPHVGWNTIEPSSAHVPAMGAADPDNPFDCPLLAGVEPGTYFYFTHSYVAPTGPFSVTQTTHSVTFTSGVQYGDVAFGVQFHPEKSSDAGAVVLRNFVDIVKGA